MMKSFQIGIKVLRISWFWDTPSHYQVKQRFVRKTTAEAIKPPDTVRPTLLRIWSKYSLAVQSYFMAQATEKLHRVTPRTINRCPFNLRLPRHWNTILQKRNAVRPVEPSERL